MQDEIVFIQTDKLVPYPDNSRKHSEKQVEGIARSIKEFGFNQPVVIDHSSTIIAGHGRRSLPRILRATK